MKFQQFRMGYFVNKKSLARKFQPLCGSTVLHLHSAMDISIQGESFCSNLVITVQLNLILQGSTLGELAAQSTKIKVVAANVYAGISKRCIYG